MLLIQEIEKALYAKYLLSTLWTVDGINFYLNHAPNSKNYPIICVNYISSNNSMAMINPTTKPSGWDYVDSRFQFSIFGNDKQYTQIVDIQNRLENLFHRQSLTLGNDCTCIAVISLNQGTKFWDERLKIWHISNDFRIIAGR